MLLRSAPSFSIAAMVDSSTPVSAPFQPAWAAPMTRALGSANRIGPQSAAVTPMAIPSVRVTMASARGRASPCQGPVATTASGEWIWCTPRQMFGCYAHLLGHAATIFHDFGAIVV